MRKGSEGIIPSMKAEVLEPLLGLVDRCVVGLD